MLFTPYLSCLISKIGSRKLGMSSIVDLWVCPNCDILQGIEVGFLDNQLTMNCVSCGTLLDPKDVQFLDPKLVENVYRKITKILDHVPKDEMRFSWVSNKTLGLIFEIDREDVEAELEGSMDDLIDQLEDEFKIALTFYFE